MTTTYIPTTTMAPSLPTQGASGNMNPVPFQSRQQVPTDPRDPYWASPTVLPLQERQWNPLHPSERLVTLYTYPPNVVPFPATGSTNFRLGVYDNRPMTAQEKKFEDLVNEKQALHDVSAEFEEWKKCRAVEEEAIMIFHEVGGNLEEFLNRMLTHDQNELERRCHKKKEKERNLQKGLLVAMEQQLREAAMMEQQRMEAAAREEFRATVMKGLMANREFVPAAAAAASQQARWQQPPTSNQALPSAEPGPSSQQVQRTTRSDEDVGREFNSAVKPQQRAQSDGNEKPSSKEAGPSTNQGQQTARGQEVAPVQSNGQILRGSGKTFIDRLLLLTRCEISLEDPKALTRPENLCASCRALADRARSSEPSSSSSSSNPSPWGLSSDQKSTTPPSTPPSPHRPPNDLSVNVSVSEESIDMSPSDWRDEPALTAVYRPGPGWVFHEDEDGFGEVYLVEWDGGL